MERWLAASLPRSPALGAALAAAIERPGMQFPVATAHGGEGRKADVTARGFDGERAWLVGVSSKLRTQGAGGPAWGNQIARHSLQRCVEMGWLPDSATAAGAAASRWLAEQGGTLAAEDAEAILEHLRGCWRRVASSELGFGGEGDFALALVLAKPSGKHCAVSRVGFVGKKAIDSILARESELTFDAERQIFSSPLVCFQRKGGDGGGAGASDLQVKLNVEALMRLLPIANP